MSLDELVRKMKWKEGDMGIRRPITLGGMTANE